MVDGLFAQGNDSMEERQSDVPSTSKLLLGNDSSSVSSSMPIGFPSAPQVTLSKCLSRVICGTVRNMFDRM